MIAFAFFGYEKCILRAPYALAGAVRQTVGIQPIIFGYVYKLAEGLTLHL